MDVLRRSAVSCTPGHAVDDCTSRSQSPDTVSTSDSVSQYSFDSSASSQASIASSASSVSTSWRNVLDQQGDDAADRHDKVREYVSSVSQIAHTWANGTGSCSQPRGLTNDNAIAPLGARPNGAKSSSQPACAGLKSLLHRKTLSCLTDVQPTKPPCESYPLQRPSSPRCSSSQPTQGGQQLFAEPQKPHPRRSCAAAGFVKPVLRRENERHEINVEHLVDSSAALVAAIWPTALQQGAKPTEPCAPIISLRSFVRETLKRSRTSHSTLQVTLFYLTLVQTRALWPHHEGKEHPKLDEFSFRALQCGRRMFLAALILASKYLQDANYSAKAWSKITGLAVPEITKNEVAFLKAIDYSLHFKASDYKDWAEVVRRCTAGLTPGRAQVHAWLSVLKMLRRDCSLPAINEALLALPPLDSCPRQTQACPSVLAAHLGRRSSLSVETQFSAPVDCISPSLLTKMPLSPTDSLPTGVLSSTPARPATAIPPTPLLNKTLATPTGISPWSASRASYTPAASSMSSARSSAQSTPAARVMATPRANSPCYERVVQHLQRIKCLEKPMGACQISSQASMSAAAGALPSPQLTIASSSSDDENEAPQAPRTVVSHGLPSPVQSSIASSSDDEDTMFGEVKIPETPTTVATALRVDATRPSALHRHHTESEILSVSMSTSPQYADVYENVRSLLRCDVSPLRNTATPRMQQISLSAHKVLSRKRGSGDVIDLTHLPPRAAAKLRRITSSTC